MPHINGLQLTRQTITPVCRDNRSQSGAWEEAVRRLREHYDTVCSKRQDINECDFHLLLTVETPRHKAQRIA